MAKKNNSTANLLGKVLSQKATTPIQENKNGIIKPIEKTFLLSLPETKLQQLKQMALDKKTSVRNLINSAIDEKFFKEVGEEYATKSDKMLSSGPYILKSWVHDSEMKFEKNHIDSKFLIFQLNYFHF